MPHQVKLAYGSARLCSCGCKARKNPRRRFAPGCDNRRQLRQPNTKHTSAPQRPVKPVVGWTPEPSALYRAVVNKVFSGHYFADLSQGEQAFIGAGTVQMSQGHQCLHLGDEVQVQLQPNREGVKNTRGARWAASVCYPQPREVSKVERGVVHRWYEDGTRGFVNRSCGCRIFVAVRVPELLREGDHVEVSNFEIDTGASIETRQKFIARAIQAVPEEDNGND